MKKTCNKCKVPKPLEDFNKHHGTFDGRMGTCKQCMKVYHAERAKKLKDLNRFY